MNEQLTLERPTEQSPADWVAINGLVDQHEAGLDLAQGDSDYLRSLASSIDVVKSGGTTIPGTDEWIPGKDNYYLKIEDEDGNPTSKPVDARSARRLLNYAAALAQRDTEAQKDAPGEAMSAEPEQSEPQVADMTTESIDTESAKELALPEDLEQYDKLRAVVAKDGSRRIYGVDENGKNRQLKGDDVLKAYGYDNLKTELKREQEANEGGTPAPATTELSAPNAAEDMVVSSYVNAEGKPLIEVNDLVDELDQLAEAGDADRFEQAAQALWYAARAEARRTGNPELMDTTKRTIEEHRAELSDTDEPSADDDWVWGSLFNRQGTDAAQPVEATDLPDIVQLTDDELHAIDALDAQGADGEPADEQLRERGLKARLKNLKNAMILLPAKIVSRERQRGEPMSKREKALLKVGAVAAVLSVAYVAHRSGIFAPESIADQNLDGTADLLGGNLADSGNDLSVPAELLSGQGNSGGDLSVPAELLGGHPAEAAQNVPEFVTFSVDKPWAEGDPTLWSFVKSQGVPEARVADLLNEWNADWSNIGRNMQVGQQYDIPIELIEKYKLAG